MPTAAAARALLSDLNVAARDPYKSGTFPAYDRDDYDSGWKDLDGNGCEQRTDILYLWLDQSKPHDVGQKDSCPNEVFAGTWHDPYTGRTITLTDAKAPDQSGLVQIDHIVPVEEAHKSGAAHWGEDKKVRFAGDLNNLVPVYGPENGSKGSDDPAAWKPREQNQCDYARRWISTKAKWDLSIDKSERGALEEMLDRC